jgi:hypothetical protein
MDSLINLNKINKRLRPKGHLIKHSVKTKGRLMEKHMDKDKVKVNIRVIAITNPYLQGSFKRNPKINLKDNLINLNKKHNKDRLKDHLINPNVKHRGR